MTSNNDEIGVRFDNGCRIIHGTGANIKKPFPDIMPDLTMHELSPSNTKGFKGQLGFIQFTPSIRLPRHIHMTPDRTRLLDERILVLHGAGMVEIEGEIWVTAARHPREPRRRRAAYLDRVSCRREIAGWECERREVHDGV